MSAERPPRMCSSCFCFIALPHGDPPLCHVCCPKIAPGRCGSCGRVRDLEHACTVIPMVPAARRFGGQWKPYGAAAPGGK